MTTLSALADLQDGWDGPGSKAIHTRVFAAYATLVAEFDSNIPADLEPMAARDGGIRMEWERGHDMFIAEIEPDGGMWLDWLGVDLASAQLDMVLDLRELRGQRQLTMEAVAERMGVDVLAVQRFESGQITNLPRNLLKAYAKAVGANLRVEVTARKDWITWTKTQPKGEQ